MSQTYQYVCIYAYIYVCMWLCIGMFVYVCFVYVIVLKCISFEQDTYGYYKNIFLHMIPQGIAMHMACKGCLPTNIHSWSSTVLIPYEAL